MAGMEDSVRSAGYEEGDDEHYQIGTKYSLQIKGLSGPLPNCVKIRRVWGTMIM